MDKNTATAQKIIKGNEPLILNDPNQVWMVQSGSMAIFAVAFVGEVPKGARRYLFTVNADEILVGFAPVDGVPDQIIGVAIEETTLAEFSISDLTALVQSKVGHSAKNYQFWVARWNTHLTSVFTGTNLALTPIPLDNLETTTQLPTLFQDCHRHFLQNLPLLEQLEKETQFTQFQDRQRLNQQSTQSAIGNLISILKPEQEGLFQEGTPLLVAVGAVGHAMGIEIRPPARSENLDRLKNPLEAITRASRIRMRQVLLSDLWWEKDSGALLAYLEPNKEPVALLPVRGEDYEIFNPTQHQRFPITAEILQQLDPIAYTFYRPFPDKALQAVDVIKFAMRGLGRDVAVIIIAGLLATLLGMVTPQATGILMDQAIPDADRGLLLQLGLALLAASFGKTLFELTQGLTTLRTQTISNTITQSALWDQLLKLRLSFFRQYSTGDLQARVSAMNQIRDILSGSVMRTLFTSFFSLLNLGLLFYYSNKLAWIAVVVGIVTIVITVTLGGLTRKKLRPLQKLEGDIFGFTVQLIGGVSKLRVSAAEDRAFSFWTKKYTEQLKLTLSTALFEDIVRLFNTILPTVSSLLLYFFTVSLLVKGETGFSTGTFLAFNSAFGTFITGATEFSNTAIQILEVGILWDRARPILEAEPEVELNKADPGRLQGQIKLDRVTFRYREGGPLTLDQLTVEAKPGEFIALVGPSGSGKSTTIRLMLGFEVPEDGTLYYDGQDLAGLDIAAIRRQLGVVLQNGRINSASIFENISGGALVTMDEAWEAARMAGFAEDIENMPMGMHTVIAEGGSNLSGGQRQRLLIARSLVLKPKILIFDEATSALDNRTQAIVSQSLEKLDVTRIVVAHRLSTIRNADRIYVIEAGQVVQVGSFDQLVEQPGLFAQLMARQM